MISKEDIINDKYLHVGTNIISNELFAPVFSYTKDSFKPSGGLWTTKSTGYVNSNSWLIHIGDRDSLFYRFFNKRCVELSLNKDANICIPSNYDELQQIRNDYPVQIDKKNSPNNLIDYHRLAQKYDGIYISSKLLKNKEVNDWAVPTLNLFNTNVIKEYKPIEIEEYYDGVRCYAETKIGETTKVKPISPKYLEIFEEFNKLYIKALEKKYKNFDINSYEDYAYKIDRIFTEIIMDNRNLYDYLINFISNEILSRTIINHDIFESLDKLSKYDNYESMIKQLFVDSDYYFLQEKIKDINFFELIKYVNNTIFNSLHAKIRDNNYDQLQDIYTRSLKK